MSLYSPVSSSEEEAGENSFSRKMEDTDMLLHDEKTDKFHGSIALAMKHMPRPLNKWIYGLLFTSLLLFIVSSMLFATFWWVSLREVDRFCLKHGSYYSPILAQIKDPYMTTKFNGSLHAESIYRAPPGPEVDAAWSYISLGMGVFSLPEHEALKAGLEKGDVRIPPGYKGSGEYMASVEVNHQLHCVNFLRKAAWFNYPYYRNQGSEFSDSGAELENHLYHCTEMLRQVLMCNADAGIYGYKYVKGREQRPYPDFSTPHRCRNFDTVLEWAYARRIEGDPQNHPFTPAEGEIVHEHDP
ncbi:hypothetical protein DTO280E4_2836 [Paecilomyces variotii]|nr:hypothetical protein DTO280E4_2836 [Paecilomyces variotii]